MTEPRSYHHGNLRAALIEAAHEIVQQQGHEAVSLRSLAESLGVSRGAPYRHFTDRESLLAEVALDGFNVLNKLLQDISAKPLPANEKLYVAAREFLAFVRANPRLFRLMYEAELLTGECPHPQLAESQRQAYERHAELLALAMPKAGSQARKLRMITLWSTLYGFAKINQSGILLSYMKDTLSAGEIEAAVLQAAIGLPRPKV
jgi:AcrR family transcriptional regulator